MRKIALREPGQEIFNNVVRAMQDAEEIWGPDNELDYIDLMKAIKKEAGNRIKTLRHNCQDDKESEIKTAFSEAKIVHNIAAETLRQLPDILPGGVRKTVGSFEWIEYTGNAEEIRAIEEKIEKMESLQSDFQAVGKDKFVLEVYADD